MISVLKCMNVSVSFNGPSFLPFVNRIVKRPGKKVRRPNEFVFSVYDSVSCAFLIDEWEREHNFILSRHEKQTDSPLGPDSMPLDVFKIIYDYAFHVK